MALGTAGVVIPPPPTLPDEMLGLLKLVASGDLAQRMLDHQQAWADAHAANQAQLKKIAKVKDLDAAKARVERKEGEVDAALIQSRKQAEAMIEDATNRANLIVSEANQAREGLSERAAAIVEQEREIAERMTAAVEAEEAAIARKAEANALHAKAKREWESGKEYAARAKKMLEVG